MFSLQNKKNATDNNTVSIYSKNSMLLSSYNSRQSQNYSLNFDYPSNWSIDDVVKWLNNISLQEYCEKFRKNEIDGSVLIDEIDGLNDDIIKELIPSLGTQLKFKKALRILRNRANNSERRIITLSRAKQDAEKQRKLLETIQHQIQQIPLLIATINFQAKQIEQFVEKITVIKKPPPINSFHQSSSIVQNQLIDLPSNTQKITLASFNSPSSSISTIDSRTPSILPLPTNYTIPLTTTPVAVSIDGPKGSTGVSFPAVIHPKINGIAIKPVLNDIYNIENYGRYTLTIYDENSENILVETLVNVVPDNDICMPKKFILRDSVNNILMGATVQIKLHDQIVFTGKSDVTGTVIIPTTLPKNCYVVEINTGDLKYKSSIFQMIVYENRGDDLNIQFICRQLNSNQLEIVLKWGLIPRDLDSHLFVSDGRHIHFRSKIQGNISLDCDVTNGYGPETIKITLEPNLKYLYVVHRFSQDGLLTESGATVTFNNNDLLTSKYPYEIIQIPVVNQPNANFWIVCQIDGTTKSIQLFENTFENHNYYSTNDIPKKHFKT